MQAYRFAGIVFLLTCMVSACEDGGYIIPLDQKIKVFAWMDEASRVCRYSIPDSVVACAAVDDISSFPSPINPSTKTREIWLQYKKAHALSENNFGEESIEIINRILPETEDYNYLYERAILLSLRSFIHTNHFNAQLAAYDAYQAADILMELGITKEAASKHLSIANLQFNTGNFEIALENAKQAVELFKKSNELKREDTLYIINAYNTMGMSYVSLKHIDSAAISYGAALPLTRSINSDIWEGLVLGNIARVDFLRGNLEAAIAKYTQEATVCIKYKEQAAAGKALTGLAEVYVKQKQYDLAKQYYDSAWHLMRAERRPSIWLDYFKSLHSWFELTHQFDSAHLTFERYIALRDSVQSPQSQQLLRLQKQLQFEKQLALLRAENQLRSSELNTSRILIVSILAVLVLISILLYTIRRSYRKTSALNAELENKVKARTAELVKLNSELDTYLYRASHDVRRPILSIIGLGQLAGLTHDENERRAIQQKIDLTARDMDKMLSKIHMAYELDKLEGIQSVNVKDYILSLMEQFKGLYPEITFHADLEDDIVVNSNIRLLDIIFINIFENACIFNNQIDPEITVRSTRASGYIEVIFKDNGIGIEEKYLKSIFNPYTRYSDRSIGSGLGLHLVQKALSKLNGRIVVESTIYLGTEFKVILPACKETASVEPALDRRIRSF
jgi:signal transduction histidine kinase